MSIFPCSGTTQKDRGFATIPSTRLSALKNARCTSSAQTLGQQQKASIGQQCLLPWPTSQDVLPPELFSAFQWVPLIAFGAPCLQVAAPFCAEHITASRGLDAEHSRTACRHSAAVPIAAKGEATMHVLLVKPSGPDCGSQDVDGPSGLGLRSFCKNSGFFRALQQPPPAGVGNAGRCVHRAGLHSPLWSHFRPRLCHGPPGRELKASL